MRDVGNFPPLEDEEELVPLVFESGLLEGWPVEGATVTVAP